MSYSIFTIPTFDKQLKRLAKKYVSLKTDFADLLDRLEENPRQGKSLGNNCYKVRLAIATKGKGKSGGARVIFYIVISEEKIYLLTIYDKSEKNNLTDKELNELLSQISENE